MRLSFSENAVECSEVYNVIAQALNQHRKTSPGTPTFEAVTGALLVVAMLASRLPEAQVPKDREKFLNLCKDVLELALKKAILKQAPFNG